MIKKKTERTPKNFFVRVMRRALVAFTSFVALFQRDDERNNTGAATKQKVDALNEEKEKSVPRESEPHNKGKR